MACPPLLRIGTRGSPLALAQTRGVAAQLAAAHPELAAAGAIEVVVVRTTGDIVLDRPLAEIGGKGLFTRELDQAMLEGRIDLAVHSVKDVPTLLPDGIDLACVPAREDPRDALVSGIDGGLAALPPGAVVGTASLRRRAQILYRRPDLAVIPFRGNVGTRLARLQRGEAAATVLALAGLRRLGLETLVSHLLDTDEMLPAVGQGALGVTARADDAAARRFLAPLEDAPTRLAVVAERAFLEVLDGSCRTPIAALAELEPGGGLRLRGMVARPDGGGRVAVERRGAAAEADALGRDAAFEVRARVEPGVLAAAP